MRPLLVLVLALLVPIALPLPAAADTAGTDAPLTRDAVKEVVRDLLREEPELVLEAIRTLQAREEAAAEAARRQQMSTLDSDLRNQPEDPVLGNPEGEVVLVEFFDYACGYCKRAHPVIADAVRQRGNVRWVLKEFPILGEASVVAARLSLAASKLGGYETFHDHLMSHRGRLGPEAMRQAATAAGLDFDRLQAVAQEPWIAETIARNHRLAQTLGIRGTPFMIIGEESVPGFVDADRLDAILDRAETAG